MNDCGERGTNSHAFPIGKRHHSVSKKAEKKMKKLMMLKTKLCCAVHLESSSQVNLTHCKMHADCWLGHRILQIYTFGHLLPQHDTLSHLTELIIRIYIVL